MSNEPEIGFIPADAEERNDFSLFRSTFENVERVRPITAEPVPRPCCGDPSDCGEECP